MVKIFGRSGSAVGLLRLRRRAFAASPLSQGLNPDGLTIPNATPPGTDAHASETSVR